MKKTRLVDNLKEIVPRPPLDMNSLNGNIPNLAEFSPPLLKHRPTRLHINIERLDK